MSTRTRRPNSKAGPHALAAGPQSFEEFLYANLDKLPAGKGRRVRRVLAAKIGRRRTRVLERLEADAVFFAAGQNVKAAVGGDWSQVKAVDWSAFFANLIAFLEKILPLILQIIPLFI